MNLRDQALTGLVWSALDKWGRKLIDLLVISLLARLLSPDAFGLIALAQAYIAFTRIFVEQGFVEAIVQRDEIENQHLNTAFWVNLGISLFVAGLTLLAARPIALFFDNPELAPIIRWLSPIFLFHALSGVQHAFFKRELAFKILSFRSLVATAAGGAVGLTMGFLDHGVWSLVGLQLATAITDTIVLWQASSWRPGLAVSRRHFSDLFSFGVHLTGRRILNFFNRRSDDLLIGYFLGTTSLGYYNIAYKLLRTLTRLLSGVVSQVTFPVFSKMQKDIARLRNAFYTATRYMGLISIPAFIGMAVTASEIIPLIFGPQWTASIPVMQVLAFIGILHTIFYFNNNVILATGRSDLALGLNVIYAVANVTGFFIAVHWGIFAVALAYTAAGYLTAPFPLLVVRKLIDIKISDYLRQFTLPIIGASIMALLVIGLRSALGPHLALVFLLPLEVAAGALTYALVVYIISPDIAYHLLDMAKTSISQ